MKSKKTNAKRQVVSHTVQPVVGLFGREINPLWEFHHATREVEFARHELLSRGTETLQQFHAAQEAAFMHLLNAIENLAKGLAAIHQPNPSHQGTTHLVRRTLDGVVGSLDSEA